MLTREWLALPDARGQALNREVNRVSGTRTVRNLPAGLTVATAGGAASRSGFSASTGGRVGSVAGLEQVCADGLFFPFLNFLPSRYQVRGTALLSNVA